MSPGGEWLGLLFCQWHFGAAARAGALPIAAGPVFFCPALTAGAFLLPRMARDGFSPRRFGVFRILKIS